MPTKLQASCLSNTCIRDHLYKLLQNSTFNGQHNFKFALKKAIKSVCSFPLPIESEKDAMALEGVGPALAKEMMKARQKAAEQHNPASASTDVDNIGDGYICSQTKDTALTTSIDCSKYRPCHGRGPWAILCALHILGSTSDKTSIVDSLQRHAIKVHESCDINSSAIWSRSVKSLIEKGLLVVANSSSDQASCKGKNRLYALTPSGREVAGRLYAEEEIHPISPTASYSTQGEGGGVELLERSSVSNDGAAHQRVSGERSLRATVDLTNDSPCHSSPVPTPVPPCGCHAKSTSTVLVLGDSSEDGVENGMTGCGNIHVEMMPCDSRHSSSEPLRSHEPEMRPECAPSAIPLRQRLTMKRGHVGVKTVDCTNDGDDVDNDCPVSGMLGDVRVEDDETGYVCSGTQPMVPGDEPILVENSLFATVTRHKQRRRRRVETSSSDSTRVGTEHRPMNASTSSYSHIDKRSVTARGNTQTFLQATQRTHRPPSAFLDIAPPPSPAPPGKDIAALLHQGEWEIVLLVDKREKEYAFFESFMVDKGVRVEVCGGAGSDMYIWHVDA